MAMVRTDFNMKYSEFRGTPSEYSDYSWTPSHYCKGTHRVIKILSKKATNPPIVYNVRTHIIDIEGYCEDGLYSIPIRYCGPGIVEGVQHRTLIGVEWRG